MPNEIEFVKEVEKQACLYNYNLPEYNHKHVVDRAWKEVSKRTNLSVPDCKEKWRNIRSSFLRSMKIGKKPKKPYYLSPYIQFVMPYMRLRHSEVPDEFQNSDIQMGEDNDFIGDGIQYPPVKLERDTDEETPFEKVDVEVDEGMTSENDSLRSSQAEDVLGHHRRRSASRHGSMSNFKRKPTDGVSNDSARLNNTSMRYFLLSLLPDFENMSNDQIRLFKVKVMMLIDDIKTDSDTVKRPISAPTEAEKLQKRLINLLIRNLKRKT